MLPLRCALSVLADVGDAHACLIGYFAWDRCLDQVAGFKKARERRITPLGPAGGTPEQRAAVMLGAHDDDGIDAREMFGAAPSARSRPARLERRGGAAAIGAESVARMPIDQAARRGIGRRFAGEIGRAHV